MTETTAINAFVPGTRVHLVGSDKGPLKDLRFAAKDLFDVAGYPTGCGNHDWARHSQIPSEHAWAVQTLLDAGATLVGKTITDEISLGILGESRFDGTPLNTLAPDRVPEVRRPARRRPLRAISVTSRLVRIPEARCACLQAFVACTASDRHTDASIRPG